MKTDNQVKKALLAGIAFTGVAVTAQSYAAPSWPKEKCYGIAKAGQNDCGVPGGHDCSGGAKADNDPKEWIYVPKGYCAKVAGGSLKPGATPSKAKKQTKNKKKK